jgi:hypothetical protein
MYAELKVTITADELIAFAKTKLGSVIDNKIGIEAEVSAADPDNCISLKGTQEAVEVRFTIPM